MKRPILNLANVRVVNHAPKMVSRRFPASSRQASASYKSEGDDSEEKKELLKEIKGIVEKQMEGRAKKEDLDKILTNLKDFLPGEDGKGGIPILQLREMADEKTGVMAKLVDMGIKVQELQQKADQGVKAMDVRSQVASWMEKNKDIIQKIHAGEKITPPALEIRAVASPMLVSTVNSGSSPYIGKVEVEPGVNGFLRYPNTFWDFLTKGRTGSPTYVWVNKSNEQGAAAFIGPGVAKPGTSFELVAETSIAKKIADSAKAGTEILQDIDGMTTFIEQELRELVMVKVNEKLMNSVGSNTQPTGIQQLSTTYTTTTIKTVNPNMIDAVRAVIGQLRSGKLSGEITFFVNSIDAANMDLSKASDSGVYLLPPFASQNGQIIAGAKIIEDNNVPTGYLQAGFMKYYRILIYKDFTVTWGWENDDFTKNLVTAVGEMRLHQFFNSIYTGAFVYDTFDNVISAIRQA